MWHQENYLPLSWLNNENEHDSIQLTEQFKVVEQTSDIGGNNEL